MGIATYRQNRPIGQFSEKYLTFVSNDKTDLKKHLCSCHLGEIMGDFTRGGEELLKQWHYFFYGTIYNSLNISKDRLQPTCRYQFSVCRGPHNFSLGLAIVELV